MAGLLISVAVFHLCVCVCACACACVYIIRTSLFIHSFVHSLYNLHYEWSIPLPKWVLQWVMS